MPKFAVYYIPQDNDPFYRLGTQILGYDVRSQTSIALPSEIQASLDHFDASWVLTAQPYGFHLTISDAIDCHWSTIPLVERELADLLECFNPTHPFMLQRSTNQTVAAWGETGKYSLVLPYEPDSSLRILHTLIVARINPLGTGSGFLKEFLAQPELKLPLHKAQKTRLFYSPTIFDNWFPHFTLLNPYTGADAALMASSLAQFFDPYTSLTVQTISLLIQTDDQTNWQIYREFQL